MRFFLLLTVAVSSVRGGCDQAAVATCVTRQPILGTCSDAAVTTEAECTEEDDNGAAGTWTLTTKTDLC